MANVTRHVTIQKGDSVIPMHRCKSCCNNYHCPFCTTSAFKPTRWDKLKKHLNNHFNKAVRHEGFTIHRCGLDCRSSFHYHCFYCPSTILRRNDYENHLLSCKQKQHVFTDIDSSPTISARVSVPGVLGKHPTPTTVVGTLATCTAAVGTPVTCTALVGTPAMYITAVAAVGSPTTCTTGVGTPATCTATVCTTAVGTLATCAATVSKTAVGAPATCTATVSTTAVGTPATCTSTVSTTAVGTLATCTAAVPISRPASKKESPVHVSSAAVLLKNEAPNGEGSACVYSVQTEHAYACETANLKRQLEAALKELQLTKEQLYNSRRREKRAKSCVENLLLELKKTRQLSEEALQKLEAYKDMCMDISHLSHEDTGGQKQSILYVYGPKAYLLLGENVSHPAVVSSDMTPRPRFCSEVLTMLNEKATRDAGDYGRTMTITKELDCTKMQQEMRPVPMDTSGKNEESNDDGEMAVVAIKEELLECDLKPEGEQQCGSDLEQTPHMDAITIEAENSKEIMNSRARCDDGVTRTTSEWPHFVDGAPTPDNPDPLPAEPISHQGGRAAVTVEKRCGDASIILVGQGRTSSSDNGVCRALSDIQSRKSEKIIPVAIKEEPLEIDVPDQKLQADGETQTLLRMKQEDSGSVGSEDQQSADELRGRPVPMDTSGSDEESSDDGEMAVVTIKEELLECALRPEGGQQCGSDLEQTPHTDTVTGEAEHSKETADIKAGSDNGIVRTTSEWPVGVQKTHQRNRSVQMLSAVPQCDGITDGENSQKQNEQSEGLYICSDCGKDFFGETELNAHQRSHGIDHMKSDNDTFALKLPNNSQEVNEEVQTPFRCSHCDKGFARKGQLNRHEFIHSGQKPFNCSDCGKCFGNKWQLSAHQKIHLGEKPYSCTFCEKCFIRKGELTVHLKRHTGDKPFNCSFCGKGFTTKGEVNIHQRRHVGEKTGLSHPSSLAAKTQLS